MYTKACKILSKALGYIELFIAVIVLIAVLVGTVSLIMSMGIFQGKPLRYDEFGALLAGAFSLVIGIEFVRMLVKHSASSVIEVLLFAIARQLIVDHNGIINTLLGVVAIAGVFAIRKFLFVSVFNPPEKE